MPCDWVGRCWVKSRDMENVTGVATTMNPLQLSSCYLPISYYLGSCHFDTASGWGVLWQFLCLAALRQLLHSKLPLGVDGPNQTQNFTFSLCPGSGSVQVPYLLRCFEAHGASIHMHPISRALSIVCSSKMILFVQVGSSNLPRLQPTQRYLTK